MVRTARLVQPILHRLQLRLKLLVLHRQPTVGILQQGLEVLYPLVAREEFPFCNSRLLLERRVLVDELMKEGRDRLSTRTANSG